VRSHVLLLFLDRDLGELNYTAGNDGVFDLANSAASPSSFDETTKPERRGHRRGSPKSPADWHGHWRTGTEQRLFSFPIAAREDAKTHPERLFSNQRVCRSSVTAACVSAYPW